MPIYFYTIALTLDITIDFAFSPHLYQSKEIDWMLKRSYMFQKFLCLLY